MEAWRCAAFLAVLAESLSVDEERGLMDHRRVRTSRLPPLSRREKPCLRAGGCRGGFAGGELFRVGRYVSTGAREVVRDFERKMRHCVRRREKSFSSFLFRFRGNCGKVSPGGCIRTPIATTVAPARVPPGPGRQHVGPDHRLMCDVYRCACGNKSVHDRVYLRTALPKVRAIHNRKRDGPTRFVGL